MTRNISSKTRDLVRKRDGQKCLKCGFSTSSGTLHLHHVYPSSMGGSDLTENLVTLCKRCHEHAPDALKIEEWKYQVLMEAFLSTGQTPEQDLVLFGMMLYHQELELFDRLETEFGRDSVDFSPGRFIGEKHRNMRSEDPYHKRHWRWYDEAYSANFRQIQPMVSEGWKPDWYSEPCSWMTD